MKWKRDQAFFVTLEHEEGTRTETGLQSDDEIWGIHMTHDETKSWRGYRLVHCPTGMHLGSYRLMNEAKRAAEILSQIQVDWSDPMLDTALTDEQKREGRRVVRALQRGQEP